MPHERDERKMINFPPTEMNILLIGVQAGDYYKDTSRVP